MTNSLPLFDVLMIGSCTTEKGLMIDSKTVQDLYGEMKIQDVSYIQS